MTKQKMEDNRDLQEKNSEAQLEGHENEIQEGSSVTVEESKAPESEEQESEESEEKNESPDQEDEFERGRKELDAAKEKYIRLFSEFENFRRRTARERLELIQTSTENLMVDLLPVLDDFNELPPRSVPGAHEALDHALPTRLGQRDRNRFDKNRLPFLPQSTPCDHSGHNGGRWSR